MKTFITLFFSISYSCIGYSQTIAKGDSSGLPGDNLNLYAVLDLFQDSKTFESFEKKLNEEDSKINNLDLNNDGKTDYIKVIDHKEGETHSIVLQVPTSEKENQDVAVIEIEKDKDNKIKVQIVGNEDLYGKDYIVEPQENDSTQKTVGTINPAAKQDKTVIINNTTNNYNTTNGNGGAYLSIGYWPMMGYMYGSGYSVYSSPWYWNSYPGWWQPWTPWYWHNYYWHHHNYYNHYHNYYRRTVVYRNENAHSYYGPRKSSSTIVQKNRLEGVYLHTYHSAENNNPIKIKSVGNNPVYEPKRSNINTEQPINNTSRPHKLLPKKMESNSQPANNNPVKPINNYSPPKKEQPVKHPQAKPTNNQPHKTLKQPSKQNVNHQSAGGRTKR